MKKQLKNIELVKSLGKGAFGEVYKGIDQTTGMKVAVKFEEQKGINQLYHEYEVYSSILGNKMARVYDYGEMMLKDKMMNSMVMELLGPSLEKVFNKCERKFSTKTVFMIAKECISQIETMHHSSYVHRDIKPENFVCSRQLDKIFLVDLGLCKQFRNPHTLIHRPYKDGKGLTGTVRYSSLNTHEGIEQSRRDDLESLGYMLVYLCIGKLPWQGIRAANKKEKYKKIYDIKKEKSIKELCKECPQEIEMYLDYVRELKYLDYPDYFRLIDLFDKGLRIRSLRDDKRYDWMLPNK